MVIDEGQDFKQDWWEILQLFLHPNADVLWLEDPEQNIYDREPVELEGFVTYRDQRNFRTPTSIADWMHEYLGVAFENVNPLPGMGVELNTWTEDEEDPVPLLVKRVKALKRIGFKNEEIVILSCGGRGKSFVGEKTDIGGIKLRLATGRFGADDAEIYTDGQILFETVYRFKGQQAPAIIFIDAQTPEHASDRMKRVMFCGMTRATVRLELITVLR